MVVVEGGGAKCSAPCKKGGGLYPGKCPDHVCLCIPKDNEKVEQIWENLCFVNALTRWQN